uniref:Uncharacterized protein n=1 Tax=Marseillevirus sp. TaxID=2809551 RepID=A0AA96J0G3_9VIRU|nr:hypothetical protein MarFTMF_091 [Marseillevirus sp.]
MEHQTIQDLIEKLTLAKQQHGNLPVVVGVTYSGNYWLEPIRNLTPTSTVLATANGDQEIPVILLQD